MRQHTEIVTAQLKTKSLNDNPYANNQIQAVSNELDECKGKNANTECLENEGKDYSERSLCFLLFLVCTSEKATMSF